MKVSVLAVITGLAAYASAAPAPILHVVHEKRSSQLGKWTRRDLKVSRDAVIPMSIGLKQRNLDNGYEFLMDVSHPESSNYGKHWSMDKVNVLPRLGQRLLKPSRSRRRLRHRKAQLLQSRRGSSRVALIPRELKCRKVSPG